MKTRRKVLRNQRLALDRKLNRPVTRVAQLFGVPPRGGWIKAVREALMMSSRQLAARMGISQATLSQMERREPRRSVTLESLHRAAEAMGVRLVYGFVPAEEDGSFEGRVRRQARRVASQMAAATRQSMRLEDLEVDEEVTRDQVEELAVRLMDKGSAELWGRPRKG